MADIEEHGAVSINDKVRSWCKKISQLHDVYRSGGVVGAVLRLSSSHLHYVLLASTSREADLLRLVLTRTPSPAKEPLSSLRNDIRSHQREEM